jgi:putative aldouronate transport system substrate-binding protein
MKKALLVAVLLSVLVAASPLFAAGGQSVGGGSAPTLGTGRISYPIKTDVTLTYWVELTANLRANFTNMGETPFARGLAERTGVKLTYLHPVTGAASEQFNLIIASQDFPDLMDRNWLTITGGPEKYIEDKVIVPLNDTFDKYAPNLTAFLKANPRYDKMVKTDEKNYYVFPFLRGDDRLCLFNGIYLRKDWLDELGLQVPETFDEWTAVLSAFRDRKGARAPLSLPNSPSINYNFVYGLGIYPEFYLGNDGRVHYGSIEAPFRQYLTWMARWYREGLLDADYATVNLANVNAKMTNGTAGASAGNIGQDMGGWTNSGRATDPKYILAPAKPPVLRKGDKPVIVNIDNPYTGNGGVAMTASCKNQEIAARMLDWGYSGEGFLYYNFGVEGVSYTMRNGVPTYTDIINKNPQGWSVGQGIAAYARAAYNGPFIQSYDYQEQYFALPEQNAAPGYWTIAEPYKHKLPPILPNQTESREMSTVMGEINTYKNEMIVKFILGTEAITDASWNTYVSTINRMGMDRAIAIQNAALTRYNNR